MFGSGSFGAPLAGATHINIYDPLMCLTARVARDWTMISVKTVCPARLLEGDI